MSLGDIKVCPVHGGECVHCSDDDTGELSLLWEGIGLGAGGDDTGSV